MRAVKRVISITVALLFIVEGVTVAQVGALSSSVHSWKDNDNLIVVKTDKEGRQIFHYNIKSGKESAVAELEQPLEKPSVRVDKRGTLLYYQPGREVVELAKERGEILNATLSPDNSMVAFVLKNDLYTIEIKSGKERRLTFDGTDLILNGRASWVYYEEIFGRFTNYKAYWWAPDGNSIAFFQFDESTVPMFPIYDATGQYGSITETRYPKAGDSNPGIKLGFVSPKGGEPIWAQFDYSEDAYFGTPFWNSNSSTLMVQWMDRDQKKYHLYNVEKSDGAKSLLYKEHQETWVDWMSEVRFGQEGFFFVRDFELWEQIYYQSYDGAQFFRLTDGDNWGVKIAAFDEKSGYIIYSSRCESSLRNDLYRLDFNLKRERGEVTRVSSGEFNYVAPKVSPDGRHIVAQQSNLTTPPREVLLSTVKRGVVKPGNFKVLNSGDGSSVEGSNIELFYVTTEEGYKLPGIILYPDQFDPNRSYPVISYIYGGPNHTYVMDRWKPLSQLENYWAKEGVIQVWLDNRASGHFGKEGINYIHRNLGKWELHDYLLWAKKLKSLPYVNGEKLGITGYSYGGTMTVMALTDGADYFRYGIAGAGVYDWMLYDTHYTERYMDQPKDNEAGYRESAVINKVAKYRSDRGSLLYLTHGTADDNVHLQNSNQLIDALQKERKHFELMIYPGALHGYRDYQGVHSFDASIIFWRKVLLDR